jgi:hypothetical protein
MVKTTSGPGHPSIRRKMALIMAAPRSHHKPESVRTSLESAKVAAVWAAPGDIVRVAGILGELESLPIVLRLNTCPSLARHSAEFVSANDFIFCSREHAPEQAGVGLRYS